MQDRYSRQILFENIGEAGQQKLRSGSVVVIGCGGLGSMISMALVRAGVGKIKIIDRDFIDYHNLHRQILYDEIDVRERIPKAVAAERHLKLINSTIQIEAIVADVHSGNIESLVAGADIIIDGMDNLEGRFLINDVSLKHDVPWIYGAAVASQGMTMTIIPHKTPCLRCFSPYPSDTGKLLNSDTIGIIGPAPMVIGALQSAGAIKYLVGAEINTGLISIDVWENKFNRFEIKFRDGCPSCNGKYEYLEPSSGIAVKKGI